MQSVLVRVAAAVLVALVGGGCGLVLDLDPPDDAGTPSWDAGRDATPGTCNSMPQCDDGDACNGLEGCVDGRCTPGVAVDCADGIACTEDSCDPATGECLVVPRDELCPDDGAACTVERCDVSAGCVPGLQHDLCDDGVFCTVDICDPAEPSPTHCRHAPSDELCSAATCDPALGCQGIECESDGECFLGGCHASARCVDGACVRTNVADGTACTSDDPCSTSGACNGGVCRGAGTRLCSSPCVRCNPSEARGCDGSLLAPVGTACNDGDGCSISDQCRADGACAGSPRTCPPDANECTMDSCNPATGRCNDVAVGRACEDADACTIGTTCQPDASCGGGSSCPASTTCRTVACTGTSCAFTDHDGTTCTDASGATATCSAGVCMVATTVCSPGEVRCPDGDCCPTTGGWCNSFGWCERCNPDEFYCSCEGPESCYPRTCPTCCSCPPP